MTPAGVLKQHPCDAPFIISSLLIIFKTNVKKSCRFCLRFKKPLRRTFVFFMNIFKNNLRTRYNYGH